MKININIPEVIIENGKRQIRSDWLYEFRQKYPEIFKIDLVDLELILKALAKEGGVRWVV